ncbi:hypothetical protein FA13DRAFT_1804619 [Coprinellus micaceus]|uniref:Uncharacterized protein n=1 Tax=Coprinellus micaceus TaxID=71717 RepID=A0A4Y7S5A6_COPMI|nr:hypothetical protein FA13DRAFT_1804619 [Coprinellus micaceus]
MVGVTNARSQESILELPETLARYLEPNLTRTAIARAITQPVRARRTDAPLQRNVFRQAHTEDFAYHRPGSSLDSPSPSPRYSSEVGNSSNAAPLAFPGINLTEAFLKGRALGNDAKRSSAPAALGINTCDIVREEPQSIAQVIFQDYETALREFALAEQEPSEFYPESTAGPSRLQRDARSKSYPGSQSYSSKLFELELSPIFEDSPVFASTGNCILFEGEDSAGSQEVDKANAKEDVIVSDSSESSYGELIESKTFGCDTRYEEPSTQSPEQDTSLGNDPYVDKECSEDASDSHDASQSDHLSLGGALQAKPWPVPSLTLTQPTPESTKSSNFLAHQLSVDRIVEEEEANHSYRKDDNHSLRRVLEEVDPVGQRNCSIAHSTWLDTVESSVNTSEVEGPTRFLGGVMVDEHGSIVRGNGIVGGSGLRESMQHQTGLSRCMTRDCAESVTTQRKKRWSLISSLKSRSTTTNGRSDRSGASSIWTRLSTVFVLD